MVDNSHDINTLGEEQKAEYYQFIKILSKVVTITKILWSGILFAM
jgi:hypothetical protein